MSKLAGKEGLDECVAQDCPESLKGGGFIQRRSVKIGVCLVKVALVYRGKEKGASDGEAETQAWNEYRGEKFGGEWKILHREGNHNADCCPCTPIEDPRVEE